MSTRVESLRMAIATYWEGNSHNKVESSVLEEGLFIKLLCLERRRAERSRKRFALVLIDVGNAAGEKSLREAMSGLCGAMRETDIVGWYEEHRVLGIILTEINGTDADDLLRRLSEKVKAPFQRNLSTEAFKKIRMSFYIFPEDWDEDKPARPSDLTLYPDLAGDDDSKRVAQLLKRCMDIVGSGAALLLLSPLFLFISILVKFTSRGPVLFRQERVGEFGKSFRILKFRTMYDLNDPRIHIEYVSSLIAGSKGQDVENGTGLKIYKLTDDPRITLMGKLLRRTSLDEIPQFWNVLVGEMSLVGPRPPVQYEVLSYDIWHRRRILEAKPGITGLWQVSGRSNTSFDDMVRLDLKYAKTWSLALDLKILFRTPGAVFFANGAY